MEDVKEDVTSKINVYFKFSFHVEFVACLCDLKIQRVCVIDLYSVGLMCWLALEKP